MHELTFFRVIESFIKAGSYITQSNGRFHKKDVALRFIKGRPCFTHSIGKELTLPRVREGLIKVRTYIK